MRQKFTYMNFAILISLLELQ